MATFTCELCKQTFESDPAFTEEDRVAEMEGYFGAVPEAMRASVCGDCFEEIHLARHPEAVAAARLQLPER